jgi:hypothetical protein
VKSFTPRLKELLRIYNCPVVILSVYVHFCLHKNEPKSAANYLVRLGRTTQRCLQRTGDIGKSLALRRVAYPFFTVLLGCVKWIKEIYFLVLGPYSVPLSIGTVAGKRR